MKSTDVVALKPNHLKYHEAASIVFGSLSAKYFLNKGGIKSGHNVLIIGAAGGVGSYAVQIAKARGCHVTTMTSQKSFDFVKGLGADSLIDYKKETLKTMIEKFDIILDMVGNSSNKDINARLKKDGRYVTTVMKLSVLLGGQQLVFDIEKSTQNDLEEITSLVEQRKIKPLVDKTFPLDQANMAHEYFEKSSRKGAVVLFDETNHL
jgi:NADPH:quinone reductase-like Zn-dependent oxidoreductase